MTKSRASSTGSQATLLPVALADLDGCQVGLQLVFQGREQFLRGQARFGPDADVGNALRIHVSDDAGDFEFVLAEAQWKGNILPGQAVGCDYVIRLS